MKLANNNELIGVLIAGGVAVIRTDTLYGIVASADIQQAVARVYSIKNRNPSKSCIILVDSPESMYGHEKGELIDITLFDKEPTSILRESPEAPDWLLRQNSELAYRIPANPDLRALLAQTGPLIAPSANPEGLSPAQNIEAAKKYFGDLVDIYVDGGEVPIDTPPSRLVRVHPGGKKEWLR